MKPYFTLNDFGLVEFEEAYNLFSKETNSDPGEKEELGLDDLLLRMPQHPMKKEIYSFVMKYSGNNKKFYK